MTLLFIIMALLSLFMSLLPFLYGLGPRGSRPFNFDAFNLAMAGIEFLMAALVFRSLRRIQRLGWRVSPWSFTGMRPVSLWQLKYIIPRDEFAMTPSFDSKKTEKENIKSCVTLRRKLKKEWRNAHTRPSYSHTGLRGAD